MVVAHLEVESFVRRIREKLLEFDLDRQRDGVEAGAIRPADRLERQCEHHRIPQQRLQVEQVALQHADLVVLVERLPVVVVEEQLLERHLGRV